jgi:hypothetical protein
LRLERPRREAGNDQQKSTPVVMPQFDFAEAYIGRGQIQL